MDIANGVIFGSISGIYITIISGNYEIIPLYAIIFLVFASIKAIEKVIRNKHELNFDFIKGMIVAIFVPLFLKNLDFSYQKN